MKNFKQVAIASFVMLAVSVLSGCGKKNSDDSSAIGVGGITNGIVTTLPTQNGGSTQCVQPNPNGGQLQFTVGGSATIGFSGFSGNGSIGAGLGGGAQYIRTNASQDNIDLRLNGQTNSQGSFTASVTLSDTTVRYIAYYGSSVCGIQFNNTGLTPGTPGYMYGGIKLILGSQSGQQWLLPM